MERGTEGTTGGNSSQHARDATNKETHIQHNACHGAQPRRYSRIFAHLLTETASRGLACASRYHTSWLIPTKHNARTARYHSTGSMMWTEGHQREVLLSATHAATTASNHFLGGRAQNGPWNGSPFKGTQYILIQKPESDSRQFQNFSMGSACLCFAPSPMCVPLSRSSESLVNIFMSAILLSFAYHVLQTLHFHLTERQQNPEAISLRMAWTCRCIVEQATMQVRVAMDQ